MTKHIHQKFKATARDGRLFGRTRSKCKENVAVYLDEAGETCISLWTIHRRPPTMRLSVNAARVLHRALGQYLAAQ